MLQLNALVQHMLHVRLPLVLADDAKQHVHVLEREALGLPDEEDDKQAHADAEAAKHDEGAPPDVVDGRGRDLGDDKVEEPLRRGGETDAVLAEARREDLSGKRWLAVGRGW